MSSLRGGQIGLAGANEAGLEGPARGVGAAAAGGTVGSGPPFDGGTGRGG